MLRCAWVSFVGGGGGEISDDRLLRLAVAINAAVALLEGHERPRDIEVDQLVGKEMEVDAFGGDIGRDQKADG